VLTQMAAATRQDATRVTKNHTFPRLCENPVKPLMDMDRDGLWISHPTLDL